MNPLDDLIRNVRQGIAESVDKQLFDVVNSTDGNTWTTAPSQIGSPAAPSLEDLAKIMQDFEKQREWDYIVHVNLNGAEKWVIVRFPDDMPDKAMRQYPRFSVLAQVPMHGHLLARILQQSPPWVGGIPLVAVTNDEAIRFYGECLLRIQRHRNPDPLSFLMPTEPR